MRLEKSISKRLCCATVFLKKKEKRVKNMKFYTNFYSLFFQLP